jgi:hypothetical protein
MGIIDKIIFWLPRILSIGFIMFLSLFALDVFGEYSGLELVVALFMHLLPSLILLLFIVIAWKHELVGVFIFLFAGIFYIWMVGFGRPWSWYAFISGPALIVGVLYFWSWVNKRKNI